MKGQLWARAAIRFCSQTLATKRSWEKQITRNLLIALGIAGFATLWIAPHVNRDPDLIHDGLMISSAIGVAEGRGLYSEVFFFYAPLTTWVHAILVELFGATLLTIRIATAALIVATSLAIFLLGKQVANLSVAIASSLSYILLADFVWSDDTAYLAPWHSVTTTFLWTLSAVFFTRAIKISPRDSSTLDRSRPYVLVAGVLAGLTIFSTLQSGLMGFGLWLGSGLILSLKFRGLTFYLKYWVGGFMLSVSTILAYLAFSESFQDYLNLSIGFAFDYHNTVGLSTGRLVFQQLATAPLGIPLILVATLVVAAVFGLRWLVNKPDKPMYVSQAVFLGLRSLISKYSSDEISKTFFIWLWWLLLSTSLAGAAILYALNRSGGRQDWAIIAGGIVRFEFWLVMFCSYFCLVLLVFLSRPRSKGIPKTARYRFFSNFYLMTAAISSSIPLLSGLAPRQLWWSAPIPLLALWIVLSRGLSPKFYRLIAAVFIVLNLGLTGITQQQRLLVPYVQISDETTLSGMRMDSLSFNSFKKGKETLLQGKKEKLFFYCNEALWATLFRYWMSASSFSVDNLLYSKDDFLKSVSKYYPESALLISDSTLSFFSCENGIYKVTTQISPATDSRVGGS